jgi:hypothetical protein
MTGSATRKADKGRRGAFGFKAPEPAGLAEGCPRSLFTLRKQAYLCDYGFTAVFISNVCSAPVVEFFRSTT